MKIILILVPFFFSLLEGSSTEGIAANEMLVSQKKPSKIKQGIYGGLNGRLGNQFFQVAAALSLGLDQNVPVYFPDFRDSSFKDIRENGKKVFFRLNFSKPFPISEIYKEDPNLLYQSIPYKPGIFLSGYFQSEKFFAHNWNKIRPYLEPSKDVLKELKLKYKSLINHPFTVAVHIRNYNGEKTEHKDIYETLGRDYYDQAMDIFSDEALFVIFTDDVKYAKKLLEGIARPHIFIEGNNYINDFFLMSMMKHTIIANSSFSWWGAYLNQNPGKVTIAPKKWFKPSFHAKDDDIIPNNWFTL